MKKLNLKLIVPIAVAFIVVVVAVVLAFCFFNKSKYDTVYDKIGGEVYYFRFFDTGVFYDELKKLAPLDYLVAFDVSEREQEKIKTFAENLIEASGLEKLEAAGSSVRKIDDDVYTYNVYLLSGKKPKGLIWDIYTEADEKYPMLDYMPEKVWIAGADFTNFDKILSTVMDVLKSNDETKHAYREFEDELSRLKRKEGFDAKKFASLVKGCGFYISKNSDTLFAKDIPDFTIILRGTDDELFEEVTKVARRKFDFSEKDDVFELDKGAMTISIFKNKNDVILTTEKGKVKKLINDDMKKLSDNAEFKKMKQAIPKKSAVWCFVPSATVEELVRFAEDESKRGYERHSEYLERWYQYQYEDYLRELKDYEYERSRGYGYGPRPTPPTPPAPKGKFPYADLFNKLKEYKTPITISATRDDDGLLFVIGTNTRLPLLMLAL